MKLNPFRLNAIVEIPSAVNQIPTTGQMASKKCSDLELLKEALSIPLLGFVPHFNGVD